jgi:hypothetical protein
MRFEIDEIFSIFVCLCMASSKNCDAYASLYHHDAPRGPQEVMSY